MLDNWGSSTAKRFFSFAQHPDWLWGLATCRTNGVQFLALPRDSWLWSFPSLLYNRSWMFYSGDIAAGV
jgi:hypothetical protein